MKFPKIALLLAVLPAAFAALATTATTLDVDCQLGDNQCDTNYGKVLICGNDGWFPAETCAAEGACQTGTAGTPSVTRSPNAPQEPPSARPLSTSPRHATTRASGRPTESAPSPAAVRPRTARLSARPSAAVRSHFSRVMCPVRTTAGPSLETRAHPAVRSTATTPPPRASSVSPLAGSPSRRPAGLAAVVTITPP